MRKHAEVETTASAASVPFEMGDWDDALIHFTPSDTANALIEETTNGGTTWIQVSTVATAAGVAQRIAVSAPVAKDLRLRVDAGTTGQVRILRKRRGF